MTNRAEEALRLSEEILEDIELSRLSAHQVVMKASRLVRLVPNDEFADFLRFEREGYPLDGSDTEWLRRAGRKTDDDKYFYVPLSKIVANAESARARLEADGGSRSFAGEMIALASREHDGHLSQQANAYGKMQAVATQVMTTVYDQVRR